MIDLHRFLKNPFDDRQISLAEVLAFTTDHLQRMIANNAGGELTARIAATSSALDLVEDSATDDQTKLGLRKARKMAKENFRAALPAKVAKIVAAVEAQYGEGAPEVVECVPQGRSVFSACRDDQVTMHLQTLVNGLTAHVADLGAPLWRRRRRCSTIGTWCMPRASRPPARRRRPRRAGSSRGRICN